MPRSYRYHLRIAGLRRAVPGVVVGLSLLLAVPRRDAEDVVEPRGRRLGFAALRRCPSSRRGRRSTCQVRRRAVAARRRSASSRPGRRRGAWVVVGLSLLLAVPLRAAEDVVELRVRRRGVDAPVV